LDTCTLLLNLYHIYSLKSRFVAYENKNFGDNQNDSRNESLYSKRIKAGKRRTYFFDVRSTRGNDYFITITESKKRFDDNGYDRHKMFLYKEDFNKFLAALTDTVNYVKTDLMPDFDFDAFNHDQENEEGEQGGATQPAAATTTPLTVSEDSNVDDWKI
jgi:hypothetical protein